MLPTLEYVRVEVWVSGDETRMTEPVVSVMDIVRLSNPASVSFQFVRHGLRGPRCTREYWVDGEWVEKRLWFYCLNCHEVDVIAPGESVQFAKARLLAADWDESVDVVSRIGIEVRNLVTGEKHRIRTRSFPAATSYLPRHTPGVEAGR